MQNLSIGNTRKKHFLSLMMATAASTMLLGSCEKEITQGIAGTVTERFGDWMPPASGGERPYATEIYIFHAFSTSDLDTTPAYWNGFPGFPISCLNRQPVAVASSDKDGRFQAALEPGSYSVFYRDDPGDEACVLYPASWGGYGELGWVTVDKNNVSNIDIIVSHCVY